MGLRGGHQAFEPGVEDGDDGFLRLGIGEAGEVPEIGHGDGGADGLDLAALDIAGKDPLAAAPADIDLQEVDGEAPQHAALGIGAEQRRGHLDLGQIGLPEAGRGLGREGDEGAAAPVQKGQRKDGVIGRPAGAQLVQQRQIGRGPVEAPAERPAGRSRRRS